MDHRGVEEQMTDKVATVGVEEQKMVKMANRGVEEQKMDKMAEMEEGETMFQSACSMVIMAVLRCHLSCSLLALKLT